MLRIFLADDHPVVLEGLRKLINDDDRMTVVGDATNGREACHDVLNLKPDVVVMDVSMPLLNGIEATRRLKSSGIDIKVLALSFHEDLGYLNEIMEAGASGYVLKRSAGDELIHAISTVASGGIYLDPALSAKVLAKSMRNEPDSKNWTDKLSSREAEVVRLIAEGHSNKEIAGRLNIGEKSVETYKARSMTKLGLRGRADFVRYALEKGWLKSN
jgi:DNA-binding NarL/FixJ family response regulator